MATAPVVKVAAAIPTGPKYLNVSAEDLQYQSSAHLLESVRAELL
jgi:hypothetical protein